MGLDKDSLTSGHHQTENYRQLSSKVRGKVTPTSNDDRDGFPIVEVCGSDETPVISHNGEKLINLWCT